MKYGYNDYEWHEEVSANDKFCNAVVMFNIDGFRSMMHRKTWSANDEHYLKCLNEMVAMLNEKADALRNN